MPTYYVTGCSPLALPLGELSPQVTERVLQSFSNDKVNLCAYTTKIPVNIPVGESQNLQPKGRQELRTFTLSVLAVLGHLSQRERQGMPARYTERCMDNERTAVITIGDEEYTLLLTTKATKEIAGRYGGLENLGEKLMKSENFEMAIGEIVWLITLLANQSILIHNPKDKEHPKDLLTEDVVELLTTPLDLAGYKTAITEALYKGTKRNVESEKDAKNAQVG